MYSGIRNSESIRVLILNQIQNLLHDWILSLRIFGICSFKITGHLQPAGAGVSLQFISIL